MLRACVFASELVMFCDLVLFVGLEVVCLGFCVCALLLGDCFCFVLELAVLWCDTCILLGLCDVLFIYFMLF